MAVVPVAATWLVMAADAASIAYTLAAIACIRSFRPQRRTGAGVRPPVTLLKPVCGLDAGLEGNLRSFCEQAYPHYQVVFGVRAADDPAVPVVRRIISDLPEVDITLVIDERVSGANLKVSNLENMLRAARHDLLVVSDSDMRVERHYLASIVAPFGDPGVGLVVCPYFGTPAGGVASLLGAMFINELFLPGVLVRERLGPVRFGLGATMVLRRSLLDRLGGFARLADCLADDHLLGRMVDQAGLRVVLSRYAVENVVHEPGIAALLRHELRWARTIRVSQPLGHAFSFVIYGVALALIGAALLGAAGWPAAGAALLGTAVLLRLWLHFSVEATLARHAGLLSAALAPARDVLGFVVWAMSFFGRRIHWRGTAFSVGTDGLMTVAGENGT